jgi:ABC-type multidrug transport system ATPase subunit
MIVIASIHQPSTSTLLLFDNVLLLTEGQTAYYGPPGDSIRYFKSLGYPDPTLMSPAEFMLELTNTDFIEVDQRRSRLDHLIRGWGASRERRLLNYEISLSEQTTDVVSISEDKYMGYPRTLTMQSWILLHRMALVYFVRCTS